MLSNSIRRILVASGLTVATSFMTVLSASAADSTAGFTGTIDPSCAVSLGFTNTGANKLAYDEVPYAGSGAGGIERLYSNQEASFNCNTESVVVTTDVTTTQVFPAGTPGDLLEGIHTTTVTSNNDVQDSDFGYGDVVLTGNDWETDNQGNITITVESEWDPSLGEELLAGTYTATAVVTVTPN